jgi:hypothetical protein
MKRTIHFTLLFILLYSSSHAQSYCHANLNRERAMKILPLLQDNKNNRDYIGNMPMVRLVLHRITDANGSGGFTWSEIHQWIGTLPGVFNPHNICFTVVKEHDIQDDTYFNMNFFGSARENLILSNQSTNAIDVFFVEDANSGGVASGFLFQDDVTTSPSVLISREANSTNIFNTLVLAHEIAHCLGLLHTHETATCTENIARTGNGANCSTCGDQLCDTKADQA